MAAFIHTTLSLLPGDQRSDFEHHISLRALGVEIDEIDVLGKKTNTVAFYPATREVANQLSIAFKMAAKRFEDIGRELGGE